MKTKILILFALSFSQITALAADGYYANKPDFQKMEAELSIEKSVQWSSLQSMTPEDLVKMDQEELDQLYSLLTAGPIPEINGQQTVEFKGTIILAENGPLDRMKAISGSESVTAQSLGLVKQLGEYMWKGKRFNKSTMVLQNKIEVEGTQISAWRFPAKLFCGMSKLDSRRHSIIIDYAFNDHLLTKLDPESGTPYFGGDPSSPLAPIRQFLDGMVNRKGMAIRDEIRMVRPGLYLGRAYLGKVFVLNFALYNEQLTKNTTWKEDCWTGEQVAGIQGRPVPLLPMASDQFYALKSK